MEKEYLNEHKYLLAKKRVEKIKGFYWHAVSYVVVNVFLSTIIVVGIMSKSNVTFLNAIQHFGVYSTWLFWGIGLFFHWLGVFGTSVVFNKEWEERKIKEFMDKDKTYYNGNRKF